MKPILTPDFSLPADGWCHAMPLGEFPNTLLAPAPDGGVHRRRVLQICDRDSALAMVAAFNRAAAAPDFPGLLVDRDHESDDPAKTTDAWGWVMALENREDGLWCKVRWTDLGDPAVRGGRFRFLSPVFDPDACENLGNDRLRPLRLEKLGLTNDPNMKALRPLTNRSAVDAAPAPADSGRTSPGSSGRKESTMDFRAELLALLGLPAEATDEQIAQACAAKKNELENRAALTAERDQLKNRAETAETKLAALERQALEAQVEADLTAHNDVIANRDEMKTALLANRESTLKVLAALRKPGEAAEPPLALRNRATKPPDGATLANRAKEQQGLVNSIRERERQAGRTCTFDRAWELAKAEKPDLFKESREEQK